jgi:hypothetical protein
MHVNYQVGGLYFLRVGWKCLTGLIRPVGRKSEVPVIENNIEHIVLCGRENCTLKLRNERTLRVFESRVARMFGTKE